MVEMPDTHLRGSGRNPQGLKTGAPNTTATNENAHFKNDKVMEVVVERENMRQALKRVVANKGAPGVDKMSVEELSPYLKENWESIKEKLLADNYIPEAVLLIEIPKAGGRGTRTLGIPTVLDRLIQQALLQVLTPIFDPAFPQTAMGFALEGAHTKR